jgi:glycerophosphoryl diester phosphodiesterase
MILSSGDAASVEMLSDAAPGIRVGYDPCHDGALEQLAVTRDFAGFVRDAVAASAKAEMIYLYYAMVLQVSDAGFDMIAAFHDAGRRVDAYTIQRVDDTTLVQVERLLSLKVDQITTDDPEGLATALNR